MVTVRKIGVRSNAERTEYKQNKKDIPGFIRISHLKNAVYMVCTRYVHAVYTDTKDKMKKQQNQRKHSKERILERYGFLYNKEIRKAIIKKIQNGETKALLRQSSSRTIHKVFIPVGMIQGVLSAPVEADNTVKIYAVYDKNRKEIATVLPWYETDTDMLSEREKVW